MDHEKAKWCSVSEAAQMLGVSTETIRKRLKQGLLKGERRRRQVVVNRQDVDQHLAQASQERGQQFDNTIGQPEIEVRMLRERVRELEADKAFLLHQIKEKDKQIADPIPPLGCFWNT